MTRSRLWSFQIMLWQFRLLYSYLVSQRWSILKIVPRGVASGPQAPTWGGPQRSVRKQFFHEKKQLIEQYILIVIFIILEGLKTALKVIKAPTPSWMSRVGSLLPAKSPRTPKSLASPLSKSLIRPYQTHRSTRSTYNSGSLSRGGTATVNVK